MRRRTRNVPAGDLWPEDATQSGAGGKSRANAPAEDSESDSATDQHGRRRRKRQDRRGFARQRVRRLPKVEETSAGGLVLDTTGSVPHAALIARLDRRGRLLWSLPKGHLEEGETAEMAAIREVKEETGIDGEIVASLGVIDFWFVVEDRRIHKTVHHFLIKATGGELSDEDIEVVEVQWVPLPEVSSRLAYADERRLVAIALEMLADAG